MVGLVLPTAENLYLAAVHLALAPQLMHHGMNLESVGIAQRSEMFQFQILT
jgi:hypothetical protein